MKRVISVGNCSMDHGNLESLIHRHFSAQVVQTHGADDLQSALAEGADLILINRKFDRDGSDGLELVRVLKAEPKTSSIPVMLLTNFPEFQSLAVQSGAAPGFGKNDLNAPQTLNKLRAYLE